MSGAPGSPSYWVLCERCEDDGWIDVNDEDGNPIGGRECPDLYEPWHAPFNASGLLDLGSTDGSS